MPACARSLSLLLAAGVLAAVPSRAQAAELHLEPSVVVVAAATPLSPSALGLDGGTLAPARPLAQVGPVLEPGFGGPGRVPQVLIGLTGIVTGVILIIVSHGAVVPSTIGVTITIGGVAYLTLGGGGGGGGGGF
jgi:hypothetical protein